MLHFVAIFVQFEKLICLHPGLAMFLRAPLLEIRPFVTGKCPVVLGFWSDFVLIWIHGSGRTGGLIPSLTNSFKTYGPVWIKNPDVHLKCNTLPKSQIPNYQIQVYWPGAEADGMMQLAALPQIPFSAQVARKQALASSAESNPTFLQDLAAFPTQKQTERKATHTVWKELPKVALLNFEFCW